MEPRSDEPRLKKAASGPADGAWFQRHVMGLIALAIGVIGFTVVALSQDELWSQPDWKLSVPFFVASVATGAVSLVRREGAIPLPLLGIGLAAAAMVLGWFLVFGIVIGLTVLVILILSQVM